MTSGPETLRKGILVGLAALVALLPVSLAASAAGPATETLVIRGHPQGVRVYGTRDGPVTVVASGDGGWVHLARTSPSAWRAGGTSS
jgi:hypothetical protein